MIKRRRHTILLSLKCLRVAVAFLCILYTSLQSNAQTTPSREYQVKAVFLYNFTQFVEWPPEALSGNAPFIIGILGNDPFGSYIDETVAGETMLGHPIQVQRYEDIKDVKNCHILFISRDQQIKEVISALNNHSTLTVSDTDNFANNGGMIRFFTQNNKIRLQINPSAAKAVKLNISSKLLRVAEIVD